MATPEPDSRGDYPDEIDRRLEAMLEELDELAAQLRASLTARREKSIEAPLSPAQREILQRAEVDRLSQHLERTKVQWSEVRAFIQSALHELGLLYGRRPAQPRGDDAADAGDTAGPGRNGVGDEEAPR
jgi:hypothetical protein